MEQRPTIGVPTQTLQVIDGIPEGLPHSWVMNHRYLTALASVGAVPWMVPLLRDEDTLRAMYERLDGVFIAGGVDVDPASYAAERHERCGNTDPERDRVEVLFARWAMEEGKPVLGVCRGMQVINVAAGGTLWQDCAEQIPQAMKHDYFPTDGYERDYLAHGIRVVEGTRLRRIFQAGEVMVNSMHHQALCDLGRGLVVSAIAPDGLIEAIEVADSRFVVGVQWHPEMLIERDPGERRLFRSFIEAANEYRMAGAIA